uniref:Uncharacterized protein n=1 Tax=Meloidogyne enterolobii TaxID=390850 RepID=A0A6V7VBH0_MELEN|nr:unnamed protein product [Meloidogyne enterolobii]
MPVSCPTNNTSVEKFWIPLFDDQTLDLESKKKSQLPIASFIHLLKGTLLKEQRFIAMSGVLIQVWINWIIFIRRSTIKNFLLIRIMEQILNR